MTDDRQPSLTHYFSRPWLSYLISRFPKYGFLRSVVTLMTGTVTSQMLTIASAPILTRLYAPEDFGVFALYGTVIFLSAPVISVRYELAIVPANDEDEAFGLLVLSCVIALCIGVSLTVLILLKSDKFMGYIGLKALMLYSWIIPISIVASGIYHASQYFCIRRQQYRRIGLSQMLQSSISTVIQIFCGQFLHLGVWGLLIGQLSGIIISMQFLCRSMRNIWPLWYQNHRGNIFVYLIQLGIRHRKHPIYMPWGGIVNSLGQKMPVLLLSTFYGPHFLGLYALAERFIQTPISLVRSASSQVLLKKMSDKHLKEHMDKFIMRWVLIVSVLSVIPFMILYFLSKHIFSFALGNSWVISGELSKLLIPYFWGVLAVSPIATLLIIAKRQGVLLAIQVMLFLSGFSSLWLGHLWFAKGERAVLLYSLSQFCVYIIYFVALLSVAKGMAKEAKMRLFYTE